VSPVLEVSAPAKVNLTLRITGRRADAYHLLEGLTVFTRFGDRLRISLVKDTDRVSLSGPFAGSVEGANTITKAIDLYRAAARLSDGVHVELEKRIPVAAGLGGGSADAAAVLNGLQSLLGAPVLDEDLHRLALSIGADVPVCLGTAACHMSGIGERLQPVTGLPDVAVVLVNPRVGMPTATVFSDFAGPYHPPVTRPVRFSSEDALFGFLGRRTTNSLQPAAGRLAPEIVRILDVLDAAPGVRSSGMSGSGATCFALFGDDAGEDAPGDLAARCRTLGWWAEATRLLGGDGADAA